MIEFKAWPKITRLSNEVMTVTEKIDGTNACVVFLPLGDDFYEFAAQSRSRIITPDKDNFGFAQWVHTNHDSLFADLGFGYHYGEWWGSGIQRGYGLEKGQKRFSVFNAVKWTGAFVDGHTFKTPDLAIVPLLYHGPANLAHAQEVALDLYVKGSQAAPGFTLPEGVVIHLKDADATYKITDAVQGEKHRV